jgi:hypothetical protein
MTEFRTRTRTNTNTNTNTSTRTRTSTNTRTNTNTRTIDYTAFDGCCGSGGSGSGSSDTDDTYSDGGSSDSQQLIPIPPTKYNFSPLLDCMIRRRMGSGVCNSSHIAILTSSFEKSQWYLLHVKGKNRGGGKF